MRAPGPILCASREEFSMKRWIPAALVGLLLLLSLAACTLQEKEDDLPTLVIGGTLYAPYFDRDVNGSYGGIDVDIATEACRRIGYQPSFRQIDIDQRFQALEAGQVDCLWTCLTMDGREDDYLWAGPYLYAQRVVAVRADSDIKTLADLTGKRLAVQTASTSEAIILNGLNPQIKDLGQLTSFSDLGEVFTALRKGYVDAAAAIESALNEYTEEYPDQYRYLSTSLRSEALGVAFRKDGDQALVQKLANALQEMREDGTIADLITAYGLDVQKNVYGGADDGND